MTDQPTATSALAAVDELAQVLDWLASSLLPGTAKPYRAPQMSEDARAARAMEDRFYREAAIMADTIPLGESPVPLDLSVMDLLSEILTAADDMAGKTALYAGTTPLAPASSAFANPGPYLALVRAHLDAASRTQPEVLGYIEDKCDDLISRGYQQLGLFNDGQTLKAVCPWCKGRTSHKLAGEHTMRISAVLPIGQRSIAKVDPADVRWLVVCHGLNCTPPSEDCGNEHRGRPAWDLGNEGAWLAKRLEAGKIVA